MSTLQSSEDHNPDSDEDIKCQIEDISVRNKDSIGDGIRSHVCYVLTEKFCIYPSPETSRVIKIKGINCYGTGIFKAIEHLVCVMDTAGYLGHMYSGINKKTEHENLQN